MKPLASLSLDLDNLWAYQMTHGDPGWDSFPTYLPEAVPVILDTVAAQDLTITVFVVGQDAALDINATAMRLITDAGHEVANHSFRHQPWLHRYSRAEIDEELARTEDALEEACGVRPVGFRGPGYSLSADLLDVLHERGYEYDCSTLPTVIGPLARRFYFRSAHLDEAQREERQHLFGHFRDGLQPLKPYWWNTTGGQLLEVPVTVLPGARVPFHLSYVLYLAGRSEDLAVGYFRNALRACRAVGVEPSILLHPLDFVGSEDLDSLRFFPGMTMSGAVKRRVVARCLATLDDHFEVLTMRGHAAAIRRRTGLRVRPSAAAGSAGSVPSALERAA